MVFLFVVEIISEELVVFLNIWFYDIVIYWLKVVFIEIIMGVDIGKEIMEVILLRVYIVSYVLVVKIRGIKVWICLDIELVVDVMMFETLLRKCI